MSKKETYNIYKLIFPSGKEYVGATKQTVKNRVSRHLCNNYTRLVAEQYGIYGPKSAVVETLASDIRAEDYRETEKFFIDLHGTMEENGGLNIMYGREWTELMRNRQSVLLRDLAAEKKKRLEN